MISVPEAVDFVVLSGSRIALADWRKKTPSNLVFVYFRVKGRTARKSRLLVLLPYSIWNKKQARHPQGRHACLRIALDRIATPGVVLRFFLIHTFIRLPHHIHDVHVPLGPHLPKRQGFGIRFIGLPLERGDFGIKDPFRNVRAEEDKFVSANTEKIVSLK